MQPDTDSICDLCDQLLPVLTLARTTTLLPEQQVEYARQALERRMVVLARHNHANTPILQQQQAFQLFLEELQATLAIFQPPPPPIPSPAAAAAATATVAATTPARCMLVQGAAEPTGDVWSAYGVPRDLVLSRKYNESADRAWFARALGSPDGASAEQVRAGLELVWSQRE